VDLPVARIGARHEELAARGEPGRDQRPGVELVAERQTGEDAASRGELGQRRQARGGARRAAPALLGGERGEPRRELAAQRRLRAQRFSACGGKPTR